MAGRMMVLTLAVLAAIPAGADGVRTIATATLDTWFDGSFRVRLEDVLLVRAGPTLTVEARVSREDVPGWHGYQVSLGPVVNITEYLYLDAVYGLGIDSDGSFTHEIDVSLTRETASTAISLGVKADWFPSTGYFYALPSLGGTFHPVPPLGLSGKLFVSVDRNGAVAGSFWGEVDWAFIPSIAVRAGCTLGNADEFAWSLIVGVNVVVSQAVMLKYTFKYLADSLDALPGSPVRRGIENGLVLDVRL